MCPTCVTTNKEIQFAEMVYIKGIRTGIILCSIILTTCGFILDGDGSCPVNCRCQQQMINCSYVGLTSLTTVSQIMPVHFPNDIRLAYNNIDRIPAYAFSSYNSTYFLDLSNNPIAFIGQDAFAGMNNLEYLYITHTLLRTLPSMTSDLPKIKFLNIWSNYLTTLNPDFFRQINHVFGISVVDNHLSNWPFPSHNAAALPLEKIWMGANMIKSVPAYAFSLYNETTRLNLSHNPIDHIGTDAFAGMDKLEMLILTHTNIRSLPDMSKDLPSLFSLDVSHNFLTYFNPNFLKSITRSSVSLSASNNRLFSWPRPTAKLNSLDLSNNHIGFIPVDALANSSDTLEYLNLDNTRIHKVTEALKCLKSVTRLTIAHNDLGDIDLNEYNLSPSIRYLDIQSTNITRFPRSLKNMTSLYDVTADNNTFEIITDEEALSMRNITSLSIRNCSLTRIPSALGLLTKLEGLYMKDNPIHSIERLDLKGLSSLRSLNFGNTQIRYISADALINMPYLIYLRLQNTSLAAVPDAIRNVNGSLYSVQMDENPVVCSCDMKWIPEIQLSFLQISGQCRNKSKSIQQYIETELTLCA